jgi:hypothetical protein
MNGGWRAATKLDDRRVVVIGWSSSVATVAARVVVNKEMQWWTRALLVHRIFKVGLDVLMPMSDITFDKHLHFSIDQPVKALIPIATSVRADQWL